MNMRRLTCTLALLGLLASAAPAAPRDPIPQPLPSGKGGAIGTDDVIYFPMTDRFYRGHPYRDVELQPDDPKGFHGGDLRGLAEKADYIRGLGVTALWLSPFMLDTDEHHFGDYVGKGYHGYWVHDHYQVEPRQGTEKELVATVKLLKSKGIKVIADIVLNQVGPDHPWLSDPGKYEWFNHVGPIRDWEDQYQAEYGDLGGLPDLNQDNPQVYRYLLDNTVYWVKKLDLDGIRLDAVKHIPKRFWKTFIPDLRRLSGKPELFVLGEVFKGDPDYLAGYQSIGLDYLYDFALHGTIVDVIGKGATARKMSERFAQDKIYPDAHKLVTIMDNHDLPRFITVAQGDFPTRLKRLELATAFLACVRGIPCYYYGTEVGLEGGDDPDNRRDMDFNRHPEVRQNFTRLMNLRQSLPALRRGAQLEMQVDDQVYCFARRAAQQEVVCIFNTSLEPQKRTVKLLSGSPLRRAKALVAWPGGQELRLLDGQFEVEIPGLSPLIVQAKK